MILPLIRWTQVGGKRMSEKILFFAFASSSSSKVIAKRKKFSSGEREKKMCDSSGHKNLRKESGF